MAIRFEQNSNIFSLDTANTTYQMKVDQFGVLQHLYYGAKIYGDAEYTVLYLDRGAGGTIYDSKGNATYTLDSLPREYPGIGVGDFRSSAVIVQNADSTESCDLRYVSHEIRAGKYALNGLPAVHASEEEAQTLSILLEDPLTKVQVELLYGVLEENDIITRSAKIVNGGKDKVVVEKAASACLDFLYGNYDLISFHGTIAMEREFQRTEIAHGSYSIGSRRGTSSHQYNPAVIVAEHNATEDAGSCYGMVFVYSGNFLFEAEKDQHGQTRAIMGLQTDKFHYSLESGEVLVVPETILTYSENGFGELSQRYHRVMLEHVCRGKFVHQTRPVLLNSWEACYMDFTGETIYQLAKEAAELGIEMLVMDDGWFGYRNNDKSSLGDWYVNEEKLGCTLKEMIDKVNALGVKFGIWFEPEMISEDSDLYRAHPDWAIQIPGRRPVLSRTQLVLDFSRKEVRDHIFNQVCDIVEQGNIEYIKWDMNRSLEDLYSTGCEAGKLAYNYLLGVYEFLEKLTSKYPNILLEGCCSGGGRFDAGMLYYSPQIWCSDNTDALDRVRIQYGTSFFYPISAMGAHVSAVPNAHTQRTTSLNTRGVVAMGGTFGYEMNPALLSDEEKEEIKEQVVTFKKYADLIREGKYYRLSNPYQEELGAWQCVSENGDETLISMVRLAVHGSRKTPYVKLKGLIPEATYVNVNDGKTYNGLALMKAGMPLPGLLGDGPACQIYLKKQ